MEKRKKQYSPKVPEHLESATLEENSLGEPPLHSSCSGKAQSSSKSLWKIPLQPVERLMAKKTYEEKGGEGKMIFLYRVSCLMHIPKKIRRVL